MAKTRTVFVCQECGKNSPRELGKCPACGSWNSFVEEIVAPAGSPTGPMRNAAARSEPRRLSEISSEEWQRLPLPIEEFSRVLGGGVVPGSIVLIGGDPGIGKTTLLSSVTASMAELYGPALYVSGEESTQQIKMRCTRMGITTD